MENKNILKKFGVGTVQSGLFREGFIDGLEVAENFYEKDQRIFVSGEDAIKEANQMIYALQKEKNRLEKELIEANKIIKDMEENAEEFAKDCEERIKKKYGVKE